VDEGSGVRMSVRPGYKQTEIGIIPEDWEIRPLLSAIRIANGQVDPRNEPYKSMILVAPDHIEGKTGRLLELRTAEEQKAISGKYVFASGDIIYSKIRPYLRKATLAEFSGLCSADMYPLKAAQDVAPSFMLPILLGERFSRYAESVSVRSGMPKINRAELAEYIFPLPRIDEQLAIAEALTDVDVLLAKLDQLIAKKRDLKQAAMQQLLTGQTRLPGFSGEWEVKRLSDVASFYKGKGLPKSAISAFGAEPCIHYGELFTQYPETIAEIISRTDSTDGTFRSVANDVLMPTSDVTPRGLAKASCVRTDGVILGGDILIIRSDAKLIFGSFLSYLIRYQEDQVLQLVTGSTVFHLYGSDMKKFVFAMPSLPEQTSIATVLSDMDAELASLEVRRDKTQSLKQGMMQELLTGRIRLV
jgi:type I restriction enzyme, S subunit